MKKTVSYVKMLKRKLTLSIIYVPVIRYKWHDNHETITVPKPALILSHFRGKKKAITFV